MTIDTSNSFKDAMLGTKAEDNRLVQGGQSGNKVVNEGDTSNFGGEEEMGKQQFLELLVTQLQHQDPLSPSENEEFVAQLATFSGLESSQNIEASIVGLNDNMSSFIEAQGRSAEYMTNSSAANLIGRQARIGVHEHYSNGSTNQPIQYHKDTSGAAYLELSNAAGEVVALVPMDSEKPTGDMVFEWDGANETGELVPPGEYNMRITGHLGHEEKGFSFVESQINGVTYKNGASWLNLDSGSYELKDLKQVVDNDL